MKEEDQFTSASKQKDLAHHFGHSYFLRCKKVKNVVGECRVQLQVA